MSTEKVVRYTAEKIRLFLNYGESWIDGKNAGQINDEILYQAARTEDDLAMLVEALQEIRDYEGDPNTPVRNSARKSGIARAALARFQQ